MKNKAEIEAGLSNHIQQHGEWLFNIPLPYNLSTRKGEDLPDTRLKRILQIASDVSCKPLSECRILDLGCLEGKYSIEFGLHGADVTGVEIRDTNIKRAIFLKEAYGLNNVTFSRDDVRNISAERHGQYDIIICSGILYHLPEPDVFSFVENIYDLTDRLAIIDTHISLNANMSASHAGKVYHGHLVAEHNTSDSREIVESRALASIDNRPSFIFSRPSLANLLQHVGFSSVYECFDPPHLNFGRPGLEHLDRCTFLAVKGQNCKLHTSPSADSLQEDWPEDGLSYSRLSLSYAKQGVSRRWRRLLRRTLSRH